MGENKPMWHRTLELLSSRFERASEQYRISTLVIHAVNSISGQRRLNGPRKHHFLRGITGIGKPVMPAVKFLLLDDAPFPFRAIHFGGKKEGVEVFKDLTGKAGWLIDEKPIADAIPTVSSPRIAWINSGDSSEHIVRWIMAVHYFGQLQNDSSAFRLERLFWGGDGFHNFDETKWPKGKELTFFFTFSRNTFSDSAAAIEMLLSSPPKDWVKVSEAAELLALEPGNVSRMVDDGKLVGRGSGADRRISPGSLVALMLSRRGKGGEPKVTAKEKKEQELVKAAIRKSRR